MSWLNLLLRRSQRDQIDFEALVQDIRLGSYAVWSTIALVVAIATAQTDLTTLVWVTMALAVPLGLQFFPQVGADQLRHLQIALTAAAAMQGILAGVVGLVPLPTLAIVTPISVLVLLGGLRWLTAGIAGGVIMAAATSWLLGPSPPPAIEQDIVFAMVITAQQLALVLLVLRHPATIDAALRASDGTAETDGATGLLNRRAFTTACEASCASLLRYKGRALEREGLALLRLRVVGPGNTDSGQTARALMLLTHPLIRQIGPSDHAARWSPDTITFAVRIRARRDCDEIASTMIDTAQRVLAEDRRTRHLAVKLACAPYPFPTMTSASGPSWREVMGWLEDFLTRIDDGHWAVLLPNPHQETAVIWTHSLGDLLERGHIVCRPEGAAKISSKPPLPAGLAGKA